MATICGARNVCMSANCYCDIECCSCCGGECYDQETQECCQGLTIYDKATERCCYDVPGGNICPKSPVNKTCCEGDCCDGPCCYGTCCNSGEDCCDDLICYDTSTKKCCNQGTGHTCQKSPVNMTCCAGDCCNESCCNSSDCEHCDSWACEPCLRKASNYEELEGCSKVVDDPDHTPTPNGCGPEGGPSVPDNPTGCEDTSFLGACNEHDECYGTCGSNKSTCDDVFLGEVYGETCTGMLCICSESSCAPACFEFADLYYGAVGGWGESAWKSAQVSACACCDC